MKASKSTSLEQLSELIHSIRANAGLADVPVTVGILTERRDSPLQSLIVERCEELLRNRILSLVDWQDSAARGHADVDGEDVYISVAPLIPSMVQR